MSGALPEHRPGHRPTEEVTGFKHVLRPGGVYKNGRCVEWHIDYVPTFRHVLVPLIEPGRVSKHARGRIRPRTRAEQTRVNNRIRRFIQISKSMTVDQNTLGAIYDEVAA